MKNKSHSFIKDPEMVKQVLLERDKMNMGGVDVLLSGKPGCGKTTALCQILIGNMKRFGDVGVFRSSEDCQWSFFLDTGHDIVFWLKKGLDMELISRKDEKKVDILDYVDRVERWEDYDDLVDRLDRKKINVVQTIPFVTDNPRQHFKFSLDWLKIFQAMNRRIWKNHITVCFDEFEDFVPEGGAGKVWDVEMAFSGTIRKLRKNFISSFCAVHYAKDVHWRTRSKIRWHLYMKGARPVKDSRCRINLHDLDVGKAVLDGGRFERFSFQPLGTEKFLRARITVEK